MVGAQLLVDGMRDLQPARELDRYGRVADVTESLVYLDTGRGTHVGAVRVRIADHPRLIYLADISPPDADLDDTPLGWQPATPQPATCRPSRSDTSSVPTTYRSPWPSPT